ncbi:AAA family ATPase [Aliarcobacter butzleri]|uniref:AAA family ATPase n=1 Tax=Aliarcobacter butzleri TaxID=28197 RepID=UPI003AF7DCCB
MKGIQKIQKLSLIKHIKEGNIRLKNIILEKTFIEELFIEAFKVGFLFIRDFMYIFKIQTNRVELFNNYLFKYINKIMKDIDEVGLIKSLFILSFNEYSKKLNDFDKVRVQNSLNILMNLNIEFNKFKEYKINFYLEAGKLLTDLDDYFKIFDIGERLNILKKSIDLENNDVIIKITDEFFNTYELIIKNSIKPFSYELYPSLSSGQKAILFIFARINDAIQKINQKNPNENILILLDEADLKLHLEWQRKFLYDLIEFLNNNPNNKFYILYATHSPMILSDITNDRVVFLRKREDNSNFSEDKQDFTRSTFGANIYDIYNDSFFVTHFMGEFAQDKINEVIKIIDESKEKKEKNPNEFMPNEKALDNLKIVKSIGEPLLRNKLEDEIKSLVKDDIMEIVNNLKNKKNEEIEKELEKYSQFTQTKVLMKLLEIRK